MLTQNGNDEVSRIGMGSIPGTPAGNESQSVVINQVDQLQ